MNPSNKVKAFSLIEVVVAVGIFAIAIVSVIGLLVPITNSVVDVRDGDYAARLVTLAQSQIQNLGFNKLAGSTGYLDNPPAKGIYASMDGSKLALGDDPIWKSDAEKFFKIELKRNTDLSKDAASDATAGFLAFNMIVTWTVYSQNGKQVATPQLSTMTIPCAITR